MEVNEERKIDQIRRSQAQFSDWKREQDTFIPLSGCHDPRYQGNLNLDEAVNQFLTDEHRQVMFLAVVVPI